jgi:hypothetical protein
MRLRSSSTAMPLGWSPIVAGVASTVLVAPSMIEMVSSIRFET